MGVITILFTIVLSIIIIQRLSELLLAKRNEITLKNRGAIEYGQAHYGFIVLVHSMFFISYIAEVMILKKGLSPYWISLTVLFVAAQLGRAWAISSLGPFWNTKIIVLPKEQMVKKGPYKYVRHPNYVIVTAEFILIPLFFQAYITAAIFSLLNAIILCVRIPAEEKALQSAYEAQPAFALKAPQEKNMNKV